MLASPWLPQDSQSKKVSSLEGAWQIYRSQCSTCEGEPLWECAKSALRAMQGSSIVIFDWDDTLFPTTALDPGGNLDDSVHQLSEHLPWHELAECAAAALQALRAARTVGDVLIVTNSDHGWVHETAARWPHLAVELCGIPVISARSIFAPQGISSPKERKELCFRRIVECFHSGLAGSRGVQSLVSIGDSLDEHQAAMKVAQNCPCYVKSLRLMERPTLTQLAQQLQVFSTHLPLIASHAGNLDVDLGHMVAVEGILAEDILKHQLLTSRSLAEKDKECGPGQKKRRLLSRADFGGA